MDWNHDGKKDLLVGDADGFVHVFLNEGDDAQPKLAAGKRLSVAGKVFQCPSARAKPWAVDWDNDGKLDLLCGEEDGSVRLLLNVGTPERPEFKAATPLKDRNRRLNGGMRACPAAWDWNGDGKKDLLCADEFGFVRVFLNQGTDASPSFAGSLRLRAKEAPLRSRKAMPPSVADLPQPTLPGHTPICRGYRSALTIADWNHDGKSDLIYGVTDDSSNEGSIFVYLAE